MTDEGRVHVALRRRPSPGLRYVYLSMMVLCVFSSVFAIGLRPSVDRIVLAIALLVGVSGPLFFVWRRALAFKDGEVGLWKGQPCLIIPPSNYYTLNPKIVKISRADGPFLILAVTDPDSKYPNRSYSFDLRFKDSSDKNLAIRKFTARGLRVD